MDRARGKASRSRAERLAGTDRKWAVGLFLFATAYAAAAFAYRPAFVADPVGPRAFPWMLGAILAASAVALWLKAGSGAAAWPDRRTGVRLAGAAGVFVAYAALLEPLGFLLATTALVAALGTLFGASPLRAAAGGVAVAAALYAVFALALGIALPPGPLTGLPGG